MAGIGCSQSAEPPAVEAQTVTVPAADYETGGATVVLPKGEPRSGRQAFLDLQCVVCHRAAGEPAFPPPVSVSQGPDLGATLRLRPTSELAAAIVLPSHAISLKTSDATKARLEGGLSPMGDFSRIMTIRQLADLLAFLRSLDTPA